MNNTDLIKQARELCDNATPGPWGTFDNPIIPLLKIPYNAALMATSRTLVPALADALEAAQAEIERLKADVHRYQTHVYDAARLSVYQEVRDKYTARAEKAEAERDAAVEDSKKLAGMAEHEPCKYCRYCGEHATICFCKRTDSDGRRRACSNHRFQLFELRGPQDAGKGKE